MQVGGLRRGRQVRAASDHGVRRLAEEKRRMPFGIIAHLARVIRVIEADAIDSSDREPLARPSNGNGWDVQARKCVNERAIMPTRSSRWGRQWIRAPQWRLCRALEQSHILLITYTNIMRTNRSGESHLRSRGSDRNGATAVAS